MVLHFSRQHLCILVPVLYDCADVEVAPFRFCRPYSRKRLGGVTAVIRSDRVDGIEVLCPCVVYVGDVIRNVALRMRQCYRWST